MKKISKKEKEKILKLRARFPKKINVSIHPAEEGGFCATINDFRGCHTQSDTFSELIVMVNDCLYTYFEIPSKYLQYMPVYLPALSVAAKLDFPQCLKGQGVSANFIITRGQNEKVAV
jgi:predicted RNase H-like HicB family nuclease